MSTVKKVNLSAMKSEKDIPVSRPVSEEAKILEPIIEGEENSKKPRISLHTIKKSHSATKKTKNESPKEQSDKVKTDILPSGEKAIDTSGKKLENNTIIPDETEAKNTDTEKQESLIALQKTEDIIDLGEYNLIKTNITQELFANYHSDFSEHTKKIKKQHILEEVEETKKTETIEKKSKSKNNKNLPKIEQVESDKIKVYLNKQSQKKKLLLLPPLILILLLTSSHLLYISPEGSALGKIRNQIVETYHTIFPKVEIIPEEVIVPEVIVPEVIVPEVIVPEEVIIPEEFILAPEEQKKQNLKKGLYKLFQ